ncbi:hypothetical protein KQI65_06975 [bacterium]|nr:hypothetical protein [bacterium]
MFRYSAIIIVAFFTTLTVASAQSKLPNVSIKCNGSAVVVHNHSDYPVPLGNMSLMWKGRTEAWWKYDPETKIILKAGESRGIRYDEIVKNYDPEADDGYPYQITIAVSTEDKKPALLQFGRDEDGLYTMDENLSMVITPEELQRRAAERESE